MRNQRSGIHQHREILESYKNTVRRSHRRLLMLKTFTLLSGVALAALLGVAAAEFSIKSEWPEAQVVRSALYDRFETEMGLLPEDYESTRSQPGETGEPELLAAR